MIKWFALIIFLYGTVVSGQNANGYYDYQRLVNYSSGSVEQQKKISELTSKYDDTLKNIVKNYSRVLNTLHIEKYSEERRLELNDSVEAIEVQIDNYRHFAMAQIMSYEKYLQDELNAFLNEQIMIFERRKGLKLVSIEQVEGCESCIDYTDEILDFISDKI